jgi:hypothetical protein
MNNEQISRKEMRKFHAMIRDIAKQVPFQGELLTPEEWKLLIFAAIHGQAVVPNPITGQGFVVWNKKRTKDLSVTTGAELITQLYAFGAEKGVEWSDPSWQAMRAQEAQERVSA